MNCYKENEKSLCDLKTMMSEWSFFIEQYFEMCYCWKTFTR